MVLSHCLGVMLLSCHGHQGQFIISFMSHLVTIGHFSFIKCHYSKFEKEESWCHKSDHESVMSVITFPLGFMSPSSKTSKMS